MAGFGRVAPIANSFASGGLPKAGQLPKAPQPPKPPSIMGRIAAGHPNWFPSQHPAGGVGSAGSALTNLAGKLTQPQAPQNTPSVAPSGGADQPSGLDSTYYQNVAANQFKVNNQINADQTKYANDQIALQAALGQLAYQEPRSDLALEQGANNRGALFSSVYNQQLGDLGQKFLTQRNADQTRYGNDMQSLTAAIAALQGSVPLYNASQAEASAQRAAAAAQANPSLGANVPATAAPTPAAKGSGKPGKGKASGVGSSLLNLAGNLSKGRKR